MIKPVIAAAVLLVLCTVHISSGSYQIGYGELFNALFTGQADDTAATVIFNIRLPRLLSAVIAGVSLSVSGVLCRVYLEIRWCRRICSGSAAVPPWELQLLFSWDFPLPLFQ